jgi:aminopeptidase 2
LDVKKETSNLVVNASGLEIGSAFFSQNSQQGYVMLTPILDTTLERATFELKTTLPAGSKAQVRIPFKGKIASSAMGYYRSSWNDDGKKRSYALTQFEVMFISHIIASRLTGTKPTAARRAFPCFDEPLLKATFAITMISRADTVNLSNMPVVEETEYRGGAPGNDPSLDKLLSSLSVEDKDPAEKWKVTKFETTPLVCAYFIALVFPAYHFVRLDVDVSCRVR